MKLHELASVVRSKNAGPFLVTIDVFLVDRAAFARVRDAGVLSPTSVASLYQVHPDDVVGTFWEPTTLGVKITLRKRPSVNDLACDDLFGSHQHVPVAMAEVP